MMPPTPPLRDPRNAPITNDRVRLSAEGTTRIVIAVAADQVVWRFEGGSAKRTVSLAEWRNETGMSTVIQRGG